MSRRALVLSTVLVGVVSFVVAFAIAANRRAPVSPARAPSAAASSSALPVMWQVPAFSLRDQNGRPTSPGDFRGHVVIADFVFTSCTSICPLITAKMALLQRRLTNDKLRFVSFSVDPARDTPEVLKEYADEWRPGEARWVLLSTTAPELEKLAKGMFVAVEPAKNDIAHSNLFFLIDARGGVRGIYESDRDDAIERLVRDTEELLGAEPGAPRSRQAATGSELYATLGCGACHARQELAPPLEGLVGRRIALQGGGEVTADAAYVRESIVAPDAKLVAGSALRMPSYEKELTPGELDALVGYVETLPQAAPPAKGSTASAKPASSVAPRTEEAKPTGSVAPRADPAATPSANTAQADSLAPKSTIPPGVATDPVCSMTVRIVDSTPRATHAGRTFYFCSEMCRERFVAEPARYTK